MPKKLLIIATLMLIAVISSVIYIINIDTDPYTSQPSPELPVPPLKELAENRGLQIGSFASLKYLRERPYSEILASEFEHAIIDGEPNWQFEEFTLRPGPDEFDFANMDQVFDFADQNDMPVRVQHLLWGEEKWLPAWLKEGNYNQQELLDIIRNHILTVTERYKGKVREYTVVNEAFSRELETGGNTDWWGENLDMKTYIDNAFIWARQGDPEAILILNDFGNETEGDISNLMYDYIRGALQRGVPIDGLGMQMHIDATNAPSKDDVKANMERFAELGVKIYITEFDVNMHYFEGSQEAEEQRQAYIYSDLLKACLEVGPEVCPSFGVLGLVDRQSWFGGIGLDEADPLLFRDNYEPKPSFFALWNTLASDK